jgi:hypothetical protein
MATHINYSTQQPVFNQSIPLNNYIPLSMTDNIKSLPTDKSIPSETDIHMINSLFGENKTVTQKLMSEGKEMLIIGLLFFAFSLPQIDELIQQFVPATKTSNYILIMIKALAVMILFWLIKNFYLSRQQ